MSNQSSANNFANNINSSRVSQPSEPEKSDGTRALFVTISLLSLAFAEEEEAKIRYAGSYLTGYAYTWFKPHVDQDSGDIAFACFDSFLKSLRAAFDDPDSYATAEIELESLKQDGSCAAYYASMISLFAQLGWTEPRVQIHHFW
ncbi:hypothetical protein GcM1_245169 [Golovinomyces cichoracearum]|uniref:Retrotransposon gag domain-containing protein n=1 Tax=Golovinomyces cichoracearum TaxID=62708 RepID=A0A420IFF4_9PEZI|nr:hypothetical protein GcM1_245169 [Golovinomyces cichoracearum]